MKNISTNVPAHLLRGLLFAAVALVAAVSAHGQSAYFQAVENLNPAAYWPLQETNQPPEAFIETNIGSLGAAANMYYSSPSPTFVFGDQLSPIANDYADSSTKFLAASSESFGLVPTTDNRVSLPAGGPFTVEVWTEPIANGSYAALICQRGPLNGAAGNNASNYAAGWCLNQNYVPLEDDGSGTASGALQGWSFAVYNGVGGFTGAQALAPYQFQFPLPQPNGWYHVVGVFDGTNANVYVNGVLMSSSETLSRPMPAGTAFVPDTWDPLQVCASRGVGANNLSGFLGDVAIYTNALKASQITNHYYQATNGNAQYASAVLSDGAYMYWRMNAEQNGLYQAPSYGNNFPVATNYGSLASSMQNLTTGASGVNAAIYQPATLPGVQGPPYAGFGSPSYACAFNGLNGAVDAGYNPAMNPTGSNGTNSFSVVGWFKGNPFDNNGRVNSLFVHGNASWRATVINGATHFNYGPGSDLVGPAVNINDGKWHMFAGVYNQTNATQTVFIDGAVSNSAAASTTIVGDPAYEILLGGSPDYAISGAPYYTNSTQRYMAGMLAHVAYFTNALSFAQIQGLYSAAEPPPLIVTQPAGVAGIVSGGTTNVFTVTASGANPLQYQWYYTNAGVSTAIANNGSSITGATTAALTLTNLANANSGSYYVVVSNSYGSVTSRVAAIQISAQPVIVSQTPTASTWTMYTNQSSVFSVSAVGTAPLTYQWYTNGVADTTAGMSSSYALNGLQPGLNGSVCYCIVSNSSAEATSAPVTVTVLALPTSLTTSAYGSAILALSPAGYWPMHEVGETPAPADVETNLGTLGAAGAAYYADWDVNFSVPTNIAEIDRQLSGAIGNDPDTAAGLVRGPGSYLAVPHTTPQTTIKPPFTVEAWAYPTETGSYGILVGQGGGAGVSSGANYGGFDLIWSGTTNSFSFAVYNGSGSANNELKTVSVYSENQWYHVVASYDGTNIALYVNGTTPPPTGAYTTGYQSGTNVYSPYNPDYWSPLCIGSGRTGSGGATGNPFGGVIDEVAVYTNILSSNTVAQHYTDGVSGANGVYKSDVLAGHPLLYYRMDAPGYSQPPRSAWPVLYNYGTNTGNGVYSPGTAPGTATAAVAGLSGTAVAPFNGMSTFADVGSALPYNDQNYNSFSYTAMFKTFPTDDRQWQCIMSGNDASFRSYILGNGGNVQGHGNSDLKTATTNFNDGNWHQMLVIAQGNAGLGRYTNLLYVDGALQISNNATGSNAVFTSPGPEMLIGNEYGFNITNAPTGAQGGTERCLAGSICEAAFFNYAVPTTTAAALFNAAGIAPYFVRQPISGSANAGANYTNYAVATGSVSNTITYQWYNGGAALAGQTSTNLVLVNLTSASASANYYCVASNAFGEGTSSVVALAINASKPVILATLPSTSSITVLAGSMISFQVTVGGSIPFGYLWYSNGIPVQTTAGTVSATSSFSVPTASTSSSGTYTVVVTNGLGAATNSWVITVLPVSGGFVPAVLALHPYGLWLMNEPGDGIDATNFGICHDYINGNNGAYENAITGAPGYNYGDAAAGFYDTNTSAGFGPELNSCAYNISNVVVSTAGNGEFTVEAWVQAPNPISSSINTPGIVGKGLYNHEEFALDLGNHVGSYTAYRFEMRNSAETTINANSAVVAGSDANWHFVVGVCDQANSNVVIYIDGTNAGSATSNPGTGVDSYSDSLPVMIGSRTSGSPYSPTGMNEQFTGNIADVAIFTYALTSNQVAAEYLASGVAPQIITQPPASTNISYGATLIVPAAAEGSGTLSYQWQDMNNNNVIGQTNSVLTIVDLTTNNSFSLLVSNQFGTALSSSIYVTVVQGAPSLQTDITPTNGAALVGGGISFTASFVGSQPITYGWQLNGVAVTNNSRISGANTTTLTITDAQSSDSGSYQLFATNTYGSSMSSAAPFNVYSSLNFNDTGAGWTGQFYSAGAVGWMGDNVVQLTGDKGGEDAAIFFSSPVYVGAFEATFVYQVPTGAASSADGLTFCVQNDPRGAQAIGGAGGSLGVGTGAVPNLTIGGSIVPSVEFEFNIYAGNSLGGVGCAFDTGGNLGPNFVPGAVVINNGDPITTVVNYANGTLNVTLTDPVISATYTATTNINIPAVLGANQAYVGFTAADGGSASTQQVSNFSFVSLLTITAQQSGHNLVLSWPDASGAYILQQSPVLGAKANWTTVTASVTDANGQNQVALPLSGAATFYRLVLQ